ncbi:MAG: bifunctional non-homologous end joining protein LigD [Candidatus Aldehydirespiratoraceae bacterium]|jgi:bifunctional non-homologous end joining protein LigD
MQMYVPLNTPHEHDHASDFALAVAQLLEKKLPKQVLSNMTKELRKTTIAPYSWRAKDRPSVSAPLLWGEVSDGAEGEPLGFEAEEALERIEMYGDLFAETLSLQQELPVGG